MLRLRLPLLVACASSLTGCSVGKEGGDTGELPPSAGGFAEDLKDSACAGDVPEPRRFPQMAYFFTEEPIATPTADREIQRGFLLYGGMDPGSSFSNPVAFNDLWLYDLTSVDHEEACHWYEISPSTGTPLFGGAMGYVEDSRTFAIVGGVEVDGPDAVTTSELRTLSLDALTDAFAIDDVLDDLEYAVAEVGSPACSGSRTVTCYDGSCAVVESVSYIDPCNPPGSEVFTDLYCQATSSPYEIYAACATDPQCTAGSEFQSGFAGGIALAGGAFDYGAGTFVLHGGATGCLGTCDADHTDLFDMDLTSDQHLLDANAEFKATLNPITAAVSTTPMDTTSFSPSGWPDDASLGIHGLAGVAAGQEWSLESRRWTHSSGAITQILIGGTAWQDLVPSVQEETECVVAGDCGGCAELGASSTVTGDVVCSDELDCLVPHAISAESSGSYSSIGSSMEVLLDPAAIGLSGERVAVIGGRNDSHTSGRDDVVVVDVSSGASEDGFSMGPSRFGAGAVYDPVSRRGYVFGGSQTSSDVSELNFEDSAAVNVGTWTATGYHAGLSFDGTNWEASASWDQEFVCTESHCYADEFMLHVPSNDAGELGSIDVDITYADSGSVSHTISPLLVTTTETWSGTEHRQLTYSLPVIVVSGESIHVSLSYERTSLNTSHDIFETYDAAAGWRLRSFLYGPTSGPEVGYLMSALPAWPGVGTGADESKNQILAVEEYRFDLPLGWIAIAPGEPDVDPPTVTVTYSGYEPWKPYDHPVALLSGFDRIESGATPHTLLTSGSSKVRSFADPNLDSAARSVVDDYVLGGGSLSPDMAGDIEFLTERLGAPPTSNFNVVYLRQYGTAADTLGMQIRGSVFVSEFDDAGDIIALDTAKVGATTLHEVAHWYFGEDLDFDIDTKWLRESVPSIAALQQYPDLQEGAMINGSELWFDSHLDGTPLAPETDGALTSMKYSIGPYILSQLYWVALANGHSDADYWGAIKAMLDSQPYGGVLVKAEVEADIEGLSDGSAGGFYPEWVRGELRGVPLLGLTDLSYDGVEDTGGWVGDPVLSYEVEQVQVGMFGWDVYTQVPFVLGCSLPTPLDSVRPFAECAASQDGLAASPAVYTMDGVVSKGGTLTGATALGTSVQPTPAWLSLLRAENLFPGPQVGNLDYEHRSWLLYCHAGDTDADCLPDADGDGFPTLGDCVDVDSGTIIGNLIFPYQAAAGENPVDSLGIDYNCDGWYGEAP